ncbi:MAG: BrnT family toxin [Deltaproteobacteria bacterium]|nr:BrnT family toxin [Deltaproteobacteria bacterium]
MLKRGKLWVDPWEILRFRLRIRPWRDENKNQENIKKHGVSFEEAKTVFLNFPLEVFHDPEHSKDEERYIAVGFSERGRVLLVVHCENPKGTEIRIISARKTTKQETQNIFGGKK